MPFVCTFVGSVEQVSDMGPDSVLFEIEKLILQVAQSIVKVRVCALNELLHVFGSRARYLLIILFAFCGR